MENRAGNRKRWPRRRVHTALALALIIIVAGCSSSGTTAQDAPEFSQSSAGTDADAAAPTAVAVESNQEGTPAPSPSPTTETTIQPVPTSTPASSGADVAGEIPQLADIADIQALLPHPDETIWTLPDAGYEPSSNGEIPIIEYGTSEEAYGILPEDWSTLLCYNEDQNQGGSFIRTVGGEVRCGVPMFTRLESQPPDEACAPFPGNEAVALDPRIRILVSQDPDVFRVVEYGCSMQVTQDGVDRFFGATQAGG